MDYYFTIRKPHFSDLFDSQRLTIAEGFAANAGVVMPREPQLLCEVRHGQATKESLRFSVAELTVRLLIIWDDSCFEGCRQYLYDLDSKQLIFNGH